MSIRHTRGIYFGSGYFAGADIISKKMVNGYFACTDYCRITIIITIIKRKQKSFEKFEMIIPSNEHFWQVWFNSVQWFQRRRFKCEKLTDGRRTLTHDKSSHGLWPGELKRVHPF
jgi:hypothetical protein